VRFHRDRPQIGLRDVAAADRTPFRPTVVALVGPLDLRATTALAEARRLGGERVVALHVIEHGEDVSQLTAVWMGSTAAGLPLVTTDLRSTLPETVVEAVADQLVHPAARLTVVLGRWFVPPPWQRVAVPRMGDRIARGLAQLGRVSVVEVAVEIDDDGS
jgi:hypothetical protein